jgi:hypothetical protein
MEQAEYTKATAKFCRIRKSRTLKPSFSPLEDPQHPTKIVVNHLQSIYSGHLLQDASHDFICSPTPSVLFASETYPITLKDVHTSIKHLPPKKATGTDHIR